jgi:hypothetical protein
VVVVKTSAAADDDALEASGFTKDWWIELHISFPRLGKYVIVPPFYIYCGVETHCWAEISKGMNTAITMQ